RLGDKPTGQVGNLLIQMTRSMAFDLALAAQDQVNEDGEEEPVSRGMLKDLALTIQRLEKASMDSLNREKEIRKAFAEEAASKAESVAKQAGLTAQAVQTIENEILSIARGPESSTQRAKPRPLRYRTNLRPPSSVRCPTLFR